jgi:hypothetical protein
VGGGPNPKSTVTYQNTQGHKKVIKFGLVPISIQRDSTIEKIDKKK